MLLYLLWHVYCHVDQGYSLYMLKMLRYRSGVSELSFVYKFDYDSKVGFDHAVERVEA